MFSYKIFIEGNIIVEKKRFILGLMGLNKLNYVEAEKFVLDAYNLGVRYVDLADIYGNGECEILFGKVLKQHPEIRKDLIIQTKCGIRDGFYDFSFEHIVSCVEQSLSRLNINYIDVLLLHRPDILCDFEELKSALTYLKENNLVKQFGVCNMNKAYIELLNKKTGFNFVINQLEFSITCTQLIDDILNMNTNDDLANDKSGEALIYCYLNNISLQAWSPLKISLSEGSFINSPKYVELNNYLDELSNKYEVSKVSIALSFIYTMPFNITPVVGVSSIAHLKDAMIAMNIKLTKKEWYKLYLLGKHKLP